VAFMSQQHRGTFQYWKPNRKWTWSQWSHAAWLIGLTLSLITVAYAGIATFVMLANLPPEIPR
jgi:hypothetical protein